MKDVCLLFIVCLVFKTKIVVLDFFDYIYCNQTYFNYNIKISNAKVKVIMFNDLNNVYLKCLSI